MLNDIKDKAQAIGEFIAIATFFATTFFVIGLMAMGVIR